ncbi:hypothetical protein [Aliamphritea ceti]|uniref:hypothetical protein n=1 Tax=Aliamphritea ceti TaxID=1524258 RepID=UPI0021C3F8C5|nr:hypothetical protein [Aliamphritea ceti]
MRDYEFSISVRLPKGKVHDDYLKDFEEHTEALVGIGNPDFLGLMFNKTTHTKIDALKQAIDEINQVMTEPDIWIIRFED